MAIITIAMWCSWLWILSHPRAKRGDEGSQPGAFLWWCHARTFFSILTSAVGQPICQPASMHIALLTLLVYALSSMWLVEISARDLQDRCADFCEHPP
jgi:hypothetical protein